jgi:hypothetical protein
MDTKVPSTYISEFLYMLYKFTWCPTKSCHFTPTSVGTQIWCPSFWQSHSPLWLAHNGQIPSGCYWIIKWYILFMKSCRAHTCISTINESWKSPCWWLGSSFLVESWAIELALWGWWLENNPSLKLKQQSLGWEGTHSITHHANFVYFYFCIHIYI